MGKNEKIYLSVFVACLLVFPLAVQAKYAMNIMIFIGIDAIMAVGLSLLFGYTGQLSICQGAFMGLGAYTTAILNTKLGLSPWLGLVAAAIVPGLLAYPIGVGVTRVRGFYLAVATLAFAEIITLLLEECRELTMGWQGIPGIANVSLFGFVLNTSQRYYYLVWVIAVLIFIFSRKVVSHRVGRALRALRLNEEAARCLGIEAVSFKVRIFVLSAVYGGIAGALYAHHLTYIAPADFGIWASITPIIIIAVGGERTVWGALVGSFILRMLDESLKIYLGLPELRVLFYALGLLFVLMFLPDGVLGLFSRSKENNKGSFLSQVKESLTDNSRS